jgi:hypothetical protein
MLMNSLKLRYEVLAAGLLGCLACNNAAHAHETQLNHAAQFCNKSGGSGTLVRTYQGTIANNSYSQDLRVLCPLVRVAGKGTTGVVNVHVVDRNAGSVRCSFYNQRAYGHTWSWSGWKNTVGSGPNNYRTFSFGPFASQDSWDGFHQIHCLLPPRNSSYRTELGSYSSGD